MFPSRDGNLAIYLFGYVRQEDVLPGVAAGPPANANADAAGFMPAEAVPPSDTKAGKARRAAAVATLSASAPSSELLEYAASVQAGEWVDNAAHAPPGPMFEPEAMLEYLSRCEPEFVQHSHPRRFCKHRMLYEVGRTGSWGRIVLGQSLGGWALGRQTNGQTEGFIVQRKVGVEAQERRNVAVVNFVFDHQPPP